MLSKNYVLIKLTLRVRDPALQLCVFLLVPIKLLASPTFIKHLLCEIWAVSSQVGEFLSTHAQRFQTSSVLQAGDGLLNTFRPENCGDNQEQDPNRCLVSPLQVPLPPPVTVGSSQPLFFHSSYGGCSQKGKKTGSVKRGHPACTT